MTASVTEPAPGSDIESGDDPPEPADLSARLALITFVVLLVVAVPVVLFGLGDYHWFFRDDFSFLTGRDATSLQGLFEPHAGHWTTIPIVIYRALYRVFGIRTYVPYQACVLALHLTACALLRVIMRRVGVSPWIATAFAGAFVFFGPGQQNIIWAFQVSFTGSLAYGLAQLVLADHDDGFDKRDVFGVLFGLLALASSAVGIVMVVVVGMATFGRRGWKAALFHVSPLAVAYVVYWLAERPDPSSVYGRPSAGVLFRWVRSGETGVFTALGHFSIVGILLGVVLVVGLVLAWSRAGLAVLRRTAALPASMLFGAILFSGFSGFGRWYNGIEFARSSRYLHIGTALTLPALAVAADAIARHSRVLTIPLIALVVVAVPANIDAFHPDVFGPAYMADRKRIITNIVRVPEAREVPRSHRPIPDVFVSPTLTMGWLLKAARQGKFPTTDDALTPELANEMRIRLAVEQTPGVLPQNCRPMTKPIDIQPKRGDVLVISQPLAIATHDGAKLTSPPVTFNPGFDGSLVTFDLDGLDLRLQRAPGNPTFALCDAVGGPAATERTTEQQTQPSS